MAVSRYEEILKQVRAQAEAQKQADKAASDAQYAAQIKSAQEKYGEQIEKTEHAYDDRLSQANVQRIINERQIRENMSNMGLTDSGLNRTQQTAVQLSHANTVNKISIAKQQAVDTLAQALAQQVATLQTAQEQAGAQIDSSYEQSAQKQATSMYNKEVDAEADVQKQYIKSQQALAETQLKQAETNQKNADSAMNNLYKVVAGNTSETNKRLQLQAYYDRYGGSSEFYEMLFAYGYDLQSDGTITKTQTIRSTNTQTAGATMGTPVPAGTKPAAKLGSYTAIGGGQTLRDIAKETGVPYKDLVRLNKVWEYQRVPNGTKILLPADANKQTK